jgi:orotidine-5'-phosphate decarboxylase
MNAARDRLIVALDVPSADAARALIDTLGESVGVYKIGLELLFAGGLTLAAELVARGARVFIDAKLLDIEATVERATAAIARTGAQFLTVHAADLKTLDAAMRGRGDSGLKLLGVTVLTNLTPADLVQQGIDHVPAELVLHRAKLALEAGFDGVVA